jgi:hypothetical protein
LPKGEGDNKMGTNTRWINGNMAYVDSTYKYRIYDAFGPTVCKYVDDFVRMPVDDTTGDPTEWNLAIVEAGAGDTVTVLESGVAGGVLLITNAGNDNDGLQAQLKGEAFKLASGKPLYFGVKLKIDSATQSDLMVGLCIQDSGPDILGAVTDGIYFRKIDGTTTCNFVLEKNTSETATAAWTAVTTAYVTLEFYFDGTNVDFYVDGVKGTRPVTTNLPDDEELTVSLAFLNGEASVSTCRVDWIRCIQFN